MNRREILVFTEGEATEKDYIDHWFAKHRERVLIDIDKFHGSPLRLVEEAIKQRNIDLREEKRGRGSARDEYWCVFDRDEHDDVKDAIAKAGANGICVAFSNPCIELWFILHFADQTAWIHRHDAQRESESYLQCKKHLSSQAPEKLDSSFGDAKSRAEGLDNKHALDGSPPRSNPSSNVWELIERI